MKCRIWDFNIAGKVNNTDSDELRRELRLSWHKVASYRRHYIAGIHILGNVAIS